RENTGRDVGTGSRVVAGHDRVGELRLQAPGEEAIVLDAAARRRTLREGVGHRAAREQHGLGITARIEDSAAPGPAQLRAGVAAGDRGLEDGRGAGVAKDPAARLRGVVADRAADDRPVGDVVAAKKPAPDPTAAAAARRGVVAIDGRTADRERALVVLHDAAA